jgi:hypothetical protein
MFVFEDAVLELLPKGHLAPWNPSLKRILERGQMRVSWTLGGQPSLAPSLKSVLKLGILKGAVLP